MLASANAINEFLSNSFPNVGPTELTWISSEFEYSLVITFETLFNSAVSFSPINLVLIDKIDLIFEFA